jgi:hypothetical protein
MSLLKTFGIDLNHNGVISLTSKAAQGKTSLMAYFVKELYDSGKNILIIGEEHEKVWVRRLKNLITHQGDNKLIIKNLPFTVDVLEYIKKYKEVHPEFDCLILDHSLLNKREVYTQIIDYVRENNIMLLFSQQLVKPMSDDFIVSDKLKYSDVCLGITKTNGELTFWKKLVNLIFKPFKNVVFEKPNIRINVLKNRYTESPLWVDYNVDFKKMNKTS